MNKIKPYTQTPTFINAHHQKHAYILNSNNRKTFFFISTKINSREKNITFHYIHTHTLLRINQSINWNFKNRIKKHKSRTLNHHQQKKTFAKSKTQIHPQLAKGRTNIELREQFILADGVSQSMAAFKPRMSSAGSTQNGSHASSPISTQGPITKVNVFHKTVQKQKQHPSPPPRKT